MAIFQSEAGKYQCITGVIGADGSKKQGEGFQAVRKFTGNYQIQFDKPFKEASVPVCQWQLSNVFPKVSPASLQLQNHQ